MNFTGGVYDRRQLSSRLSRTVNIMVNPSLRAWSETFCIANTEAMAAGLPIVSFGVGGIGEYLTSSGDNEHATCTESTKGDVTLHTDCRSGVNGGEGYCPNVKEGKHGVPTGTLDTLSSNGCVASAPTAEALAESVCVLLRNSSLRAEIGRRARETVRILELERMYYRSVPKCREIQSLFSSRCSNQRTH